MADFMSKNQDDVEVKESDKMSDFKPISPAMKDWKNKYLDKEAKEPVEDYKEEKQKITEDNLEKVLASDETLSPNQFHITMCKELLILKKVLEL